jgi:hypothetical protein
MIWQDTARHLIDSLGLSGWCALSGPNEFAATLFEVLLPRTMKKNSNATLGDIHAWIDELAR